MEIRCCLLYTSFYKLQAEIARILRHMPEVSNQYFDSREEIPKEERKIGSVVTVSYTHLDVYKRQQ